MLTIHGIFRKQHPPNIYIVYIYIDIYAHKFSSSCIDDPTPTSLNWCLDKVFPGVLMPCARPICTRQMWQQSLHLRTFDPFGGHYIGTGGYIAREDNLSIEQ